MENEYIGRIVIWEDERWYVDNTDENFKDDNEETSLFLLPEKYADEDENDELMRSGNPDEVGYWVYVSDITVV
jgi:hypothetical protein